MRDSLPFNVHKKDDDSLSLSYSYKYIHLNYMLYICVQSWNGSSASIFGVFPIANDVCHVMFIAYRKGEVFYYCDIILDLV